MSSLRLPLVIALISIGPVGCNASSNAEQASAAKKKGAKSYAVAMKAPDRVAVNEPIALYVSLEPKGAYKVNLEYPLKLVVTGDAGVKPSTLELNKSDAKEFTAERALLAATVRTTKPGTTKVTAELRFSVCTDAVCEMKRERRDFEVEVHSGRGKEVSQ